MFAACLIAVCSRMMIPLYFGGACTDAMTSPVPKSRRNLSDLSQTACIEYTRQLSSFDQTTLSAITDAKSQEDVLKRRNREDCPSPRSGMRPRPMI